MDPRDTASDRGNAGRDLVFTNFGNSVTVSLNEGNGTFGRARNYAVGARPTAVELGDVSGDGRLDVVTANLSGDSVTVLQNDKAGGFALAVTGRYVVGNGPFSVTVGDVNAN